ncbi:MAG: (Fe-S)-binding protein [Candidatus Geothermincolia bacterium]
MKDFTLDEFFDRKACDLCGDCLRLCPELSDRIQDPAGTLSDLISNPSSQRARFVLSKCSTCMSCSAICHTGANPYGLILYRWFQRTRDKGIPMRASLVMPLEEGNAWHKVMDRLPPDEKQKLDLWADLERPELSGKAIFAGCNLQIMPFMASPAIVGDLPIFGRKDMCCGEVYYRMGAFDKVASVAANLSSIYAEMGIKEVVAYCQACYNVLANILPGRFGADFNFKVSYFGDLLAERVLNAELPVKGKLKGLKVAVQDPCHSKLLGSDLRDRQRKVLEYMGCEVLEMKHTGQMSLCCGLGHGASRFSPVDMTVGTVRRLKEARATGADRLVVYCNSCDLLFSVGTQLTPFIIPVWHLNELVAEALGDQIPRRNLARARSMVSELFLKGAPRVVSPRRFFVGS